MTFAQWLAGTGITVFTLGAAAWAGVRYFGVKWLDSKFAGRIEALKLEGQRQIEASRQEHANYVERMKFERADLLDRAARLNQREFEIIPNLWMALTEAHFALLQLISMIQSSLDVGRMSEDEFEHFLAGSRLAEWQKAEIRGKSRWDKTSYYSNACRWLRLEDAGKAMVAFNRAYLGSSIFLHPETHRQFDMRATAMRSAFNDFQVNMQMGDDGAGLRPEPDCPVDAYRQTGNSLYESLAVYLRERYWIKPDGEAV